MIILVYTEIVKLKLVKVRDRVSTLILQDAEDVVITDV